MKRSVVTGTFGCPFWQMQRVILRLDARWMIKVMERCDWVIEIDYGNTA